MQTVFTLLLRLVLLAAGLIFAASLLLAALLLIAVWVLRAAWCMATGRPVTPFVMRVGPRAGFDQVFRRRAGAATASQEPPSAGLRLRGRVADIEDVQAKPSRD